MLWPSHLKCSVAMAAVVLGVAGLVGCNASNPTPGATVLARETQIPALASNETITWSYWGDPWEAEVNNRLIAVFEADHPEIKVVPRYAPWTDYWDKVEEWASGNNLPDVMFLDYLPTYASRGLLEDLTPLIQRDHYSINDFYPGLLEYNSYKGAVYGLPRDNDTKVIYYNKALFDEARLAYPTSGWTWDDLQNTAMKLTKRAGGETTQYGFAYEPDDWWLLWVRQNGGDAYDNSFSPTKTTLDSPEAIAAIQWFADLTNVAKVTPPYDLQNTSLSIGHLFQEGKLAMAFGNHALLPAFASQADLKWDVVGLPKSKSRVNSAGGSGYVITRQSKHKEAAWTFLQWLESPKGQAIFTETGVVVPARRSVGHADIFLKQKPLHNAGVFLEETELGQPNPVFSGVQDTSRLINEALLPVWKGQRSASDAIHEVVPKVNALLKQPRPQ